MFLWRNKENCHKIPSLSVQLRFSVMSVVPLGFLVMPVVAFPLIVRSGRTVDQKYVVWSDDQGRICDWNLAEKQENWLRLKEKNNKTFDKAVCKFISTLSTTDGYNRNVDKSLDPDLMLPSVSLSTLFA